MGCNSVDCHRRVALTPLASDLDPSARLPRRSQRHGSLHLQFSGPRNPRARPPPPPGNAQASLASVMCHSWHLISERPHPKQTFSSTSPSQGGMMPPYCSVSIGSNFMGDDVSSSITVSANCCVL